METIELGDRVQCRISKIKGIVTGITYWLYGCARVVIQPETSKDGKPAESFSVDMPQCILKKKHAVVAAVEEAKPEKKKSTGGPRPEPTRNREVRR
jgi:hypothetical protein